MFECWECYGKNWVKENGRKKATQCHVHHFLCLYVYIDIFIFNSNITVASYTINVCFTIISFCSDVSLYAKATRRVSETVKRYNALFNEQNQALFLSEQCISTSVWLFWLRREFKQKSADVMRNDDLYRGVHH